MARNAVRETHCCDEQVVEKLARMNGTHSGDKDTHIVLLVTTDKLIENINCTGNTRSHQERGPKKHGNERSNDA